MVAKQMHKNQSEIAYTAWQDNSTYIIYHYRRVSAELSSHYRLPALVQVVVG